MSKDPAFLFYPGDFLGGTAHMTDEEAGCYMRMLCHQFNLGPLSEERIKRLCPDAKLWQSIRDKFVKNNQGQFYNKRLLSEKERRKKYCDSRSKNRKISKIDKKTYVKDMNNISKTYVKHMETENETKTKDINKAKTTTETANEVVDVMNLEWGSKYKKSRSTLEPINARINDGNSVDECSIVIRHCKAQWMGTEMQKFLRPSTVFGAAKFEGYLADAARKQPIIKGNHLVGQGEMDNIMDMKL